MKPTQKSLLSFNAGIWAEKLDGRIDLEKYRYACRQAENMLVLPYGGLERRPGTQYIQSTKSNGFAVLWPFQFSSTVGYIVEVGNLYMRFFVDGAYIASSEIATPYTSADLRALQFRQINDVCFITHPNHHPRELIRNTATTFSIAETDFDLPAFRDENLSSTTITPSATTGASITLTASAGTFTADNVGGYYRLGQRRKGNSVSLLLGSTSSPTTGSSGASSTITVLGKWEFRTTGRWAGTVQIQRQNAVTSAWEVIREFFCGDADRNVDVTGTNETEAVMRISVAFSAATDGGSEPARAYLEAGDAFVYGYAKVTAFSSTTAVTASVVDAFYDTSATEVWEESSWSTRRGFPRSCTLYEQRMLYAGCEAQPLAVWATKIGDFKNFKYGVDDSDAFSYDIPSTEQNPIEWIAAHKVVIVGNGKEYGILSSGSDDLPLSPTNAIFRIQEGVGFSGIKPEIIGDVMVAVERNGRRVWELSYAFDAGVSGGYRAVSLNRLNDDIVEDGIVDIDFSQLREPHLYAVTSTGDLAVLHYNRQDGIVGWSKFTTQGQFESVAVIRGTDKDEIWVAVLRNINGADVRFIERFNPVTWTAKEDAYYVDAGVTLTNGSATTSVSGLSHLDGQLCQILADGAVEPSQAPSSGALTLADPATKVHVGLGYDSVYEPMRLDMDSILGSSQGHQKVIRELWVRFYKSLGMTYSNGIQDDDLAFRDTDDNMDESPPLFTGEKEIKWDGTFGSDPSLNDPKITVKQTQPLPMTLLVLVVKYGISGK